MLNQFSRTEQLIGKAGVKVLAASRVAVFGIGGVGGYVAEALARSGVGALDLFDDDIICVSNINRQIYATHSTVGQYKVDAAKVRIKDINPDCEVRKHQCFYLPENSAQFDFACYDYIVDAVDTVTAKLEIIKNAKAAKVPIICAMGAGNKLNATAFEVADIYKTRACPLARLMRKLCREAGIESLKVVYSKETTLTPIAQGEEETAASLTQRDSGKDNRRNAPGSNAYVPGVAGLIIAGEVIMDLTGIRGGEITG